jgi:protein-L-isoaspartate(D-aspartate) O-methyltransferase
MVGRLRGAGFIRSGPVGAAMGVVPRELFVPDVPIERAYANEAVVTHRDAAGVAVSSASAPGVVASMLEDLDVRSGQRVLEIGAGTGYNAALLAHLVGPAGVVTTVEIDDVVAETARERLDAGYRQVSVICGDGEFGYRDHAPYDRITVTAGAWDVPPAWSDQLAPGGRLLVPLRMRGLTRTIAFERQDGYLRSRSVHECGFIPMRGAGEVAERNIFLDSDAADVILRIDDGQPADEHTLRRALDHAPTVVWTGVRVPRAEPEHHLDFWLAALDGFCRLIVRRGNPDRGFVAPLYRWGSMAVFDRHYLTWRPVGDPDTDGGTNGSTDNMELGVCANGQDSGRLADRVADRITAWDRDRRSLTAFLIEAHPASSPAPADAWMVIDKRHTRIVVHAR